MRFHELAAREFDDAINGPSKKVAVNATGEAILHTGLCLAYYSSVSQEGIPFGILHG